MAEAKEKQGIAGEIWYIGFRPVPKTLPLPWRWFIHPNFAHVMAFRFDLVANAWVFTEWSGTKLFIEVWHGKDMDDIFAWLGKEGALVSFEARHDPLKLIKLRMPFYCVSWVKHLLGLRNSAAVTPYQLFCTLRTRGGKVIYDAGEK